MKLKLKKKNYNIEDIAIMIMVIVTLAFHNFSKFLAITQIICSLIIFLIEIRKKRIYTSKILYLIWIGMFTFWGGLSVLWASNSTSDVFITIRSLIQEAMVGFAIVLYINNDERKNRIFKYIILSAILLVGRMVLQVPMFAWGSERVGNYLGYGNNGVPIVLSFVALISFYSFQENKKKMSLILSIIFLLFSFLCGSKKAVVVAIVGIGLLILRKSKNIFQTIKRIFIIVILLFILYYSIMNIEILYNVLGRRIERMLLALTNQTGGDMSTIDRMYFAKIAFNVFKSHPFIGVGLENYKYHNASLYYAHNNYLEIAADLGVIGLILYYVMPIILFFKTLIIKNNKVYLLINIILFAILLTDVALVSFESDTIQLYIATLYGIYVSSKIKKENENEKEIV